jgi:hypothetical protein
MVFVVEFNAPSSSRYHTAGVAPKMLAIELSVKIEVNNSFFIDLKDLDCRIKAMPRSNGDIQSREA